MGVLRGERARKDIVDALEQGRTRLALRIRVSHALRDTLIDDAMGDRFDAVLCLRAGGVGERPGGVWAARGVDPLEGWIVSA